MTSEARSARYKLLSLVPWSKLQAAAELRSVPQAHLFSRDYLQELVVANWFQWEETIFNLSVDALVHLRSQAKGDASQ